MPVIELRSEDTVEKGEGPTPQFSYRACQTAVKLRGTSKKAKIWEGPAALNSGPVRTHLEGEISAETKDGGGVVTFRYFLSSPVP